MEINKVQWRMIAKGEKLPCDSFLMKKDGTITSMVTGAGVTVGQDAYYLPVEELRSFPKEESEDERIRKYLKHIIGKWSYDDLYAKGFRKEDIIAWLEKQSEQKPTENKGMNLDEDEMTPFQKKVFCIIDTTIEEEHGLKQVCDELLRLAHDEIMQNPAWSEEDVSLCRQIEGILSVCKTKNLLSSDLYKKMIYFLKSLKDRVFPQPKQEWSEEDEYHKRQILRILKDNGCSRTLQEKTEKWIEERLKSLRPQSQWKPSKEQMVALEAMLTVSPQSSAITSVLMELHEQIKKLMEE